MADFATKVTKIPSEQILVINIDYFKGDIMGYQSVHGILSGGVIEENSEQFDKNLFIIDENNILHPYKT
ncbi:MAG: hypothetical protein IKH02_12680 [Prevotella sp.]|nr:hypothetical protein [Prevotella sp.]